MRLLRKNERIVAGEYHLGCFSLTKKNFQQLHRITTSNSCRANGFQLSLIRVSTQTQLDEEAPRRSRVYLI